MGETIKVYILYLAEKEENLVPLGKGVCTMCLESQLQSLIDTFDVYQSMCTGVDTKANTFITA